MGNATGCILCDDSNKSSATLTSSIVQSVTNSCGKNLNATNVETDLSLNMIGVNCGTITFGSQKIELDVNCSIQTALHASSQSLASVIAGFQNKGGFAANLNVLGSEINTATMNVSTAITQAISNNCLSGISTSNTITSGTVDMSGCSCADATFFTQSTNLQLTCILASYQSAIQSIKAKASSGGTTTGPFAGFLGTIMGVLVLGLIAVVVLVVLVIGAKMYMKRTGGPGGVDGLLNVAMDAMQPPFI